MPNGKMRRCQTDRRVVLDLLAAAVAVAWPLATARPAPAQFGVAPAGTQFELSDTVQVERADAAALGNLERVKAFLANKQWDEAVETLRQLAETADGKLLGVTPQRFVSLRDYCQLQLAALPPDALKLYRGRADPVARAWYEQGVARRDARLLQNVVDQALASSWGDKALLALGEMAFGAGDLAAARWAWERILPAQRPADAPPTWPGYPDTTLDLAGVRARLVLVSICEGSAGRAKDELAHFARLHPDARGQLAGREVRYAEELARLLAESAAWPPRRVEDDWPTFAGAPQRQKTVPQKLDPGAPAWRVELPRLELLPGGMGIAADYPTAALGFFPIAAGGLAWFNNQESICAVRVSDGRPAWRENASVVYRDEFAGAGGALAHPSDTLGAPRFTLTVRGQRLYARMGAAVTSRPQERPPSTGNGYLVCLDLAAEGRLQWKLPPEEGWAFEGSPVADEANVYVALRRNDVRPQAHVACLDAATGRTRWRRFICAAETPARGMLHQATHGLVTLDHGTLYYNTNLGTVAAVRADDGKVLWLSLYPRALRGDLARLAPHWRRDPNPCLFDRGTLYVAPADSPHVLALDAASGQTLWRSPAELEDVQHLLGVAGDWLIACGGRAYWISLRPEDGGRPRHFWPDGPERPGFGRGLLTAAAVWFPTRDALHAFDPLIARPLRTVDLKGRGLSGGNVLTAGGRMWIAGPRELVALGNPPAAAPTQEPLAQLSPRPTQEDP